MIRASISTVALALGLLAPHSSALAATDTQSKCTELVKECFAYSQEAERTNCFYTSAKHPYCSGSRLADLAMKRWSLSSETPESGEGASALLGPELVDKSCLSNFDSAWSARLVQGDESADTIRTLSGQLSSCSAEPALEGIRP